MLTHNLRNQVLEARRKVFRLATQRQISQDGWERASKYTANLNELLDDPQASDEYASAVLRRLDQAIRDGALAAADGAE